MKKYAPSEESFKMVYLHSKAVQRAALRIAEKVKGIDIEFIKAASLLHDIGRLKVGVGKKSILHGVEGAEILRKEGLRAYAKVAERHLGAGISKEDIKKQGLPLPLKDYMPKTKEEKIIAHADNLIFGMREGSFHEVEERLRKELGKESDEKVRKLKEEIEKNKR